MTLADSAVGIAVATTLADDEAIATVDISMQFLEAAGSNDVVATGEVQKRGKRLAFACCDGEKKGCLFLLERAIHESPLK